MGALWAGPVRAAEAGATLVDLEIGCDGDEAVVSFRVENAIDSERRGEIESGLAVTFRYFLEVRKKGWIKSTVLRRDVEVSVEFDSLTGQYQLTRYLDDQVAASITTDKDAEMERWMTEVDRVPLGPLPAGKGSQGPFLFRAKARVGAGFVAVFFPRYLETDWESMPLPRCGGADD